MISTTARITVVIPCFADGATIEEAVGSVLETEPVPIVVVDDGSTDETTANAMARLRSANVDVTVLRHSTNRGVAAAINTGIQSVTSPYAFILGADDRVAEGALSILADTLDADPGLAVTWGDYEYFGAKRGRVSVPSMDPWQLTYVNRWPGVAMVRVSTFLAVDGMASATMYEDWDLWLRLAEAGYRSAPTAGVLAFHYRIHRQSVRRCAQATDRFPEEYRLLRSMHVELFGKRKELRRVSPLSPSSRVREQIGLWLLLWLPKSGRRAITGAGALARELRMRLHVKG